MSLNGLIRSRPIGGPEIEGWLKDILIRFCPFDKVQWLEILKLC